MKILVTQNRLHLKDTGRTIGVFYSWDGKRLSIDNTGYICSDLSGTYDRLLTFVKQYGAQVFTLGQYCAGKHVIAFPYGYKRGCSDATMILKSAEGLVRLLDARKLKNVTFFLPDFGGGKQAFFTSCYDLLSLMLDDRVLIVDYENHSHSD